MRARWNTEPPPGFALTEDPIMGKTGTCSDRRRTWDVRLLGEINGKKWSWLVC